MTDDTGQRPAPRLEKLDSGGHRIVIQRPGAPPEGVEVVEGGGLLKLVRAFDDRLVPENFDKADGAPLRVFDSPSVKIDVSKRSHEDMGFWHRSADFNELILCIRGALRWETELGTHVLGPGDMLYIPKGVAHRSALDEQSADENILVELKLRDGLEQVFTPS